MAITVDQSKLILNAFAATFQNNLVSKDLVTWKKFDREYNDRNGLTVVEQVAPRFNVYETVNGVRDLSSGVQDMVFGSEQYTVDRTFSADMGWGDWQKITSLGEARESEALKSAAINLAEKIDAHILRAAVLASNNWTGTPGNEVATYDDIASGYTRLKDEGVEDTDVRAVLTYHDKQALAGYIVEDNSSLSGIGDGIYREGFTGKVAGIPTLFTQQIPTFTTGTRTNGTMGGANQNVDYKAVAISGAPGQYLSQTVNLAGLGANATIKDGEVFTIAGVYAYDNRLGAPLTHLQQFRVIGDTTAAAGGTATVRIFPALIVPGTGTGGDIGVNTAHATVSAVPAAAAVVTFAAAASTAFKPRALLHKSSVIVSTADLIMPASDTARRQALSKLPLSVRMWKASDFETGAHKVRFDVALRANISDRRRSVRVNGS